MSWLRRLRRKAVAKALARRLAAAYPGIITAEQAEAVLEAVKGKWDHAKWVCEVCKLAAERGTFDEPLDAVAMAKSFAERKGWEPKL